MRTAPAWVAAALLLVSCGPLGIGAPSPAPVESWLEVLDEELSDLGAATDWPQDASFDAAAMCGPVDEVEGWRVFASVPLADRDGAPSDDARFEPPTDAWAPAEGGATAGGATTWQHQDHPELMLEHSSDGLRAIVEVPGAGERWADHPRIEQPFYCG
jgi:hypothetical protein